MACVTDIIIKSPNEAVVDIIKNLIIEHYGGISAVLYPTVFRAESVGGNKKSLPFYYCNFGLNYLMGVDLLETKITNKLKEMQSTESNYYRWVLVMIVPEQNYSKVIFKEYW